MKKALEKASEKRKTLALALKGVQAELDTVSANTIEELAQANKELAEALAKVVAAANKELEQALVK